MAYLLKDMKQPPVDGYELLSLVSYSHVPHIIEVIYASHCASNKEIATAIDIDESLCSKLLKWLVSMGIVRRQYITGHHAKETRYWLTRLGEDCGRAIHGIVAIGETTLPFEEDSCRGCANLVLVSGHGQVPDDEECVKADDMTERDIELCHKGRCPYFQLIDLNAEDV